MSMVDKEGYAKIAEGLVFVSMVDKEGYAKFAVKVVLLMG